MSATSEKIHVLHVDDEGELRETMTTVLPHELDRIVVHTAANAEEGLENLAKRDFDCIISDYDLPEDNGIEFLELVREEHPTISSILYTDKCSEEIASEAISAGVTEYLQKENATDQSAVLANRIVKAVENCHSQLSEKLNRQNFSELVETSEDILFMFSGDWSELLFVNSSYEDIWGASISELKADPASFLDYIHQDDLDEVRQLMEGVANGEPDEIEFRVVRPDGEERWVLGEVKPIFDDTETVVRIGGYVRDITEQKDYEQQVEEQRNNLDVLNQVLRHDIRNYLQVVTAYADMLADTVADENQEYVETVQENARQAIELTTTARDMSDVWLSDTDEQIQSSLKSPLENELDEIRSVHTDSVITVDGTIPDVTVIANDMLNSVFHNLLQNAIRHNDKDIPKVTVSVEEREETVEVRIADNGPGVPDTQKEAIFGKGEKGLDSSGTGLGLFLVKTVIESYDGAVWVEDNEPGGAVFVVELQERASEG